MTEGKKNTGVRFDLVPPAALWQLAEVYTVGANKYADRNWERGYAWGKSYQALQRHAARFWAGETFDPDSGLHHMAHVAFHAFALMEFLQTHPGLDDRPDGGEILFPQINQYTVNEAEEVKDDSSYSLP